jgi:hypothetical protein
MTNDYDEGSYFDQEMADIIADAAEKEFLQTCQGVQDEYDAEKNYIDELAEIRAEQESWGVND